MGRVSVRNISFEAEHLLRLVVSGEGMLGRSSSGVVRKLAIKPITGVQGGPGDQPEPGHAGYS